MKSGNVSYLLILVLALINYCCIKAQNISNPNFEIFSQCPNAQSQLVRATGWTQPTSGTPDYFNVCTPATGTSLTISPTLSAQNGTGFAGGYAELRYVSSSFINYKEYLTNRLSSPLVAGVTYRFSFYVSHLYGAAPSRMPPADVNYVDLPAAEQGYLGAVFSTTAPTTANTVGGGATSIVDGFGNGRVLIPASNTNVYGAASRNNWVQVTLQYTAAGGEEYMTLGQLRPSNTSLIDKQASYYFYDNFSVSLAPNTVLTKSVSPSNIASGGTATYTFTLNNTTAGSIAQPNLSFTDDLPSGLRLAANPNVVVTGLSGGSVTAAAGGTSVAVSGYSQAANTTATITVNVTNAPGQTNASCGSNPAAFTNTAANISGASSNITNSIGNVCLVVGAGPFVCDSKMYLLQNANTGFYNIISSTNPFTFPIIGSPAGYQYNASGFNPTDGFIYAMRTFSNNLLRIDSSGAITDLGAISGLPAVTGTTNYNSGEVDHLGNYYIKHSGSNSTMYRVNISSLTAVPITLSQATDPSDLAYSVVTNLLYGVATNGRLFSINPSGGAVTFIGSSPGTAVFGGMFGSSTGEIYGINNAGGFFQFNLTSGARLQISDAPASGNNDGAHCVTAPIAFGADLSITKTDGTSTYSSGSSTVYTIVARNNGPFGVQNATVSDLVPAGIPAANVSYTAVASSGSTTSVIGTQTGAINDVISLPANGTITYTVTVSIPASFTGNLTNTATMIPPLNTSDPDLVNNTAIDINSFVCSGPDSDGDGVPDMCDLDDDNDGILDTVECPNTYIVRPVVTSSVTTVNTITNGNIQTIADGEGAGATGAGPSPFWYTNAVSNLPVVIRMNMQSVSTMDNIKLYAPWGFNEWIKDFRIEFYNSSNVLLGTENLTAPDQYAAGVVISFSQEYTDVLNVRFTIISDQGYNTLNPRRVSLSELVFLDLQICDTDGDGIPNRLDLDSDGDGCSDAIEGAATILPSQLVTAGGVVAGGSTSVNQNLCSNGICVDANGVPQFATLPSGYSNTTGQAIGNSQNGSRNDCLDSDGDGIADWEDVDDDNDGILDTNECSIDLSSYVINNFATPSAVAGSTSDNTKFLQVRPSDFGLTTAGVTNQNVTRDYSSFFGLPTGSVIVTVENGNVHPNATINPASDAFYVSARSGVGNTKVKVSGTLGAYVAVEHGQEYYRTQERGIRFLDGAYLTPGNLMNLGTQTTTGNWQSGSSGDYYYVRHLTSTTENTVFSYGSINAQINPKNFLITTNNTEPTEFSTFFIRIFPECDTDKDGIPNRLDLDSDADGCPDAFEGGATILQEQLVTAGGTLSGGSTSVNKNLCNAPGCVSPTGTNMGLPQFSTLPSGYNNATGQGAGDSQNALVNNCPIFCYKPGLITGGTILDTKVGITSLNRAGAEDADNWPMVRKGGWIALESKTKGFVPNRVAFADADSSPLTPDVPVGMSSADFVEGMMVYDNTNHCMKIYTSADNGITYNWYCISAQTCPD